MSRQKGSPFKHKLRQTLRLGLALRLVWQSGPGWTIATVCLQVARGALPLLSLYLIKLILDSVTEGVSAGGRPGAFGDVLVLVCLAGAVYLAGELLRLAGGLVAEIHSQVITRHTSSIIHAKSLTADLSYFEDARYFDTLHRAQREASTRPPRILNGVLQVIRSVVALAGITVLIVTFHWGFAVVLVLAVLPGLLVRMKYSRTLYRWNRERTSLERRVAYFGWLLTSPASAKEIRLFELGAFLMGRFRDLQDQQIRERLRISTKRLFWESATRVSEVAAVFGSYGFLAYETVQGALSIGGFVMFYQALQRGQGFLTELFGGVAALYEDNLFLYSLSEFLELEPKITCPAAPANLPSPLGSGITMEHVSFQYPAGDRKVLEDISFEVKKGEMVALVGENGSGKTTLVKLLCRLYDPTTGSVSIDGTDLRRLDPKLLRQRIRVVLQEYGRYQLTALENIWLGDVERPPDLERIQAAARQAGSHDVISTLPRGYDTVLGTLFEGSHELSVGEWQKIALARAYLSNAEVFVLDEPTSALDAKAEFEVFTKLRALSLDKTTIVISHRFSTVRMADRIHVLDSGRIIESGTHEELVQRGAKYAGLFESQARHYR